MSNLPSPDGSLSAPPKRLPRPRRRLVDRLRFLLRFLASRPDPAEARRRATYTAWHEEDPSL